MSDVYNPWDAFEQGTRIGGGMRRQRQEAELGTAYDEGGLDAMADRAASQGDLTTSNTAHTMARRREEEPMQRLRQFGGFATSALRRAQSLPPEQRGQWLSQPHIRSRFEAFGFQPQQIDNAIQHLSDPATADEMFTNLYAAFQGDGLDWSVMNPETGEIGAIEPNTGEYVQGGNAPPQQAEWQAGYGRAYRINPDGSTEMGGPIPQAPRGSSAFGVGDGYSIVDPAEVEALGLPPGSYQRNNTTGQITVLGRQRGQYTDAAASSAQFASRMAAADQTLTGLEDTLTDPAGVFMAQSGTGTQAERQVRQAQREFVNAILRRESGAVIADSEFASAAQQYFPQPGDGPAVVEQKRLARRRALQGLVNASQGAYEEWYGDLPERVPGPPAQGRTIGDMVGSRVSGQPQSGAEEWVRDPQTGRLVPARR